MSQDKYKIIYFNGRGLAELPRLMFAYAGVEYEDCRIGQEEFLEKYKPVLPTGKVPVLEVNGKQYPESAAIVRYLARQLSLYGKDNLEALQIDGIIEINNDMRPTILPLYSEQDEAKKEEIKKKAREEGVPPILTNLEQLVGGDVFVGTTITVADIAFFITIQNVMQRIDSSTLLDNYPKLKAINDKVAKEPKIAAWVAKRPVTPW